VVILDTAGRLHIDQEMMDEIRQLCMPPSIPQKPMFVVDAMTGRDAANTAQAFNDVLP
jgi:signal recognition particle subunit SRP54